MKSNFLKERTQFIRSFIKNWRQIGSITPSSSFLAKKMIKDLDLKNADLIIELGSGTGSITRHILREMGENTSLMAFELDKTLCDFIENDLKDRRIKIINDSVLNIDKYLNNRKVDYIISGIPLACLNDNDKSYLLKSIKNSLKDGGKYVQFQYSLESYKQIKGLFDNVKIDFTFFDIPPAFIYKCDK